MSTFEEQLRQKTREIQLNPKLKVEAEYRARQERQARAKAAEPSTFENTPESPEELPPPRKREYARPPAPQVEAKPLCTITARDLLATDFPEPRWAVPNLIPEGLIIMAGRPKIGKSWLALNLVLAVDAGGPFLGERPATRGGSLYLALEDSPRRIKDRLLTLSTSIPESIHFEFHLPRLDQGGLEALDTWLDQRPDYRLAVIDVYNRVRAPKRKDVDQYQQDADAAAGLQALAIKRRIALFVLHHDRKAGADDWLDTVSGTFGLTGTADAVILLDRGRGSANGRLRLTGRDVEEQDLALLFDRGLWQIVGRGEMLNLSPERQQILGCLREKGELSPAMIHEATGISINTVKHALPGMRDFVSQPKTGRWQAKETK